MRQELRTLQEEVKKDKEGIGAWIKKWGAILGLIAGLVALPKAGIELYTALISRPRTTLTRSKGFSLGYDTVTQGLTAQYHIGLQNTGTADDMVQDITGTLQPPSSRERNPDRKSRQGC